MQRAVLFGLHELNNWFPFRSNTSNVPGQIMSGKQAGILILFTRTQVCFFGSIHGAKLDLPGEKLPQGLLLTRYLRASRRHASVQGIVGDSQTTGRSWAPLLLHLRSFSHHTLLTRSPDRHAPGPQTQPANHRSSALPAQRLERESQNKDQKNPQV